MSHASNAEERDCVVDAKDLVVGYSGVPLLPALSFSVGRRELWALVGENGSGKTTLLKTLLGLLPKVSGTFKAHEGLTIGYVPQRSEIDLGIPQRIVDVVATGLDRDWSFFLQPLLPRSAASRAKIDAAIAEVKMSELKFQPYRALSEGQRQRVMLARALVSDPAMLILDEPTNGMDIASERAAFELFAELQKSRSLAVVVVSHRMTMLAERATHAILVDRDDQIVAAGPIEELKKNTFFAERYGFVFSHHSGPVAAAQQVVA